MRTLLILFLAAFLLASCSAAGDGPAESPAYTNTPSAESRVGSQQIVDPSAAIASGQVALIYARVLPGTGSVNLRQGPSVDYAVVGQLAENIEMPVVEITPSGDWIRLDFEGDVAWVYASLIEIIGDFSSMPLADRATEFPTSEIDVDLNRATRIIEEFTGEPATQLEFLEEAAMPNAELRPGWKFRDAAGRLFWLDTVTYSLVQVEPSPLFNTATGDVKDILVLRQIAENIALEHSTRFGDLQANLDYSEGDKLAQFFFFQWEDRSKPWSIMPPMVQVGLTADGRLLSWLNTVDLTD